MELTISTEDLKSKLDQKQVTLVETLEPERYREAHIPGALNIPPERINELAPQLLPNKDAEIVAYCMFERERGTDPDFQVWMRRVCLRISCRRLRRSGGGLFQTR